MFDSLHLLTCRLGPPAIHTSSPRMRVELSPQVALPSPWIAYELPWYQLPIDAALGVADGLDALGIAVAGLHSELGLRELASGDEPSDGGGAATAEQGRLLSICPYRGGRYGLRLTDLQTARIIDVRLTPTRGDRGLAVHPPAQLRRWDARAAKAAESTLAFGPLPAMAWPPDVARVEDLAAKLSQLRMLAPQALICVSIEATDVRAGVALALDAAADMVALRAERWPQDQPRALAQQIALARDLLDVRAAPAPGAAAPGAARRHLMIVPPAAATAEDLIKMLALGADLVAVDTWCRHLFVGVKEQQESLAQWTATNLGVVAPYLDAKEDPMDLGPLERLLETLRTMIEATGVSGLKGLDRSALADFGDWNIPDVRKINA